MFPARPYIVMRALESYLHRVVLTAPGCHPPCCPGISHHLFITGGQAPSHSMDKLAGPSSLPSTGPGVGAPSAADLPVIAYRNSAHTGFFVPCSFDSAPHSFLLLFLPLISSDSISLVMARSGNLYDKLRYIS